MGSMNGLVAIVTGASRGWAGPSPRRMGKRAARVVVSARGPFPYRFGRVGRRDRGRDPGGRR